MPQAVFDKRGAFFKVDDGQGIAYGWAIVCTENGQPYVDLQGDHIPEDAMVAAAEDFSKNSRVAKDMHAGDEVGDYPFLYPITEKSKDLPGIDATRTGLLVGVKVTDPELLALIKSGQRTGFSIGGFIMDAVDEPVGKAIKKDASGPKTMRTFRTFKINEISLVDVPAQEGATIGYVKRAIAVRSEKQATCKGCSAYVTKDADYCAKCGAAMKGATVAKGDWSTATVDDFPDSSFLYIEGGGSKDSSGKTTPRSLRHFPYKDENGKVDLPHLRDAISRIPQSSLPATLRNKLQVKAEKLLAAQHSDTSKSIAKRDLLTTSGAGHTHLLDDGDGAASGETYGAVMPGSTDYVSGGWHCHPWSRATDGTIVIGEALGHVHDAITQDQLDAIVATGEADDDEDDMPANKRGESAMPDAKDTEITNLKLQLARAQKAATLTDAQRAHFAKLSGQEADAFLNAGATERDATIAKAIEADPVEVELDGVQYRKSAGPAVIVAIKKAKETSELLAKREAELELEKLEKRVTTEMPNVPGDKVTKISLLKWADANGEPGKAMLKALLAGIAPAFKTFGVKGGETSDSDAQTRFDAVVKRLQAADPKLTQAQAVDKAFEDAEGRAAYAEILAEKHPNTGVGRMAKATH